MGHNWQAACLMSLIQTYENIIILKRFWVLVLSVRTIFLLKNCLPIAKIQLFFRWSILFYDVMQFYFYQIILKEKIVFVSENLCWPNTASWWSRWMKTSFPLFSRKSKVKSSLWRENRDDYLLFFIHYISGSQYPCTTYVSRGKYGPRKVLIWPVKLKIIWAKLICLIETPFQLKNLWTLNIFWIAFGPQSHLSCAPLVQRIRIIICCSLYTTSAVNPNLFFPGTPKPTKDNERYLEEFFKTGFNFDARLL